MLRRTKIQIVQLGNDLDAAPNIILSQNVQSHLKTEKKNRKRVSFQDKEKGNCAKDNIDDEDDLKVYASMARISNDDVSKNKDYCNSSQLTNWILDSGATCHMTPEVTDFIPGTLEDTDKYICMRTEPFCFAMTWCPSATSIYLSVSSNEPGIKSVTSGVM